MTGFAKRKNERRVKGKAIQESKQKKQRLADRKERRDALELLRTEKESVDLPDPDAADDGSGSGSDSGSDSDGGGGGGGGGDSSKRKRDGSDSDGESDRPRMTKRQRMIDPTASIGLSKSGLARFGPVRPKHLFRSSDRAASNAVIAAYAERAANAGRTGSGSGSGGSGSGSGSGSGMASAVGASASVYADDDTTVVVVTKPIVDADDQELLRRRYSDDENDGATGSDHSDHSDSDSDSRLTTTKHKTQHKHKQSASHASNDRKSGGPIRVCTAMTGTDPSAPLIH